MSKFSPPNILFCGDLDVKDLLKKLSEHIITISENLDEKESKNILELEIIIKVEPDNPVTFEMKTKNYINYIPGGK